LTAASRRKNSYFVRTTKRLSGQDQDDIKHLESILDED